MILAIIVLFYIAAAIMYVGINRKSPATNTGSIWADNLARQPSLKTGAVAEHLTGTAITPAKTLNHSTAKQLLAPAERLFYNALKQAADTHEVFVKLRISDLLMPQAADENKWSIEFRKIANEYFDFVICRQQSLAVIAAIRLSPASNLSDGLPIAAQTSAQHDRAFCDKTIRAACKREKIPLIVVKEKSQYDIAQIKKLIALL